jgi:hypothetical protein
MAAKGENKVQQKGRCKRRNKKKKAVASPWPMTVQAWESFTDPAPVQSIFTRASPSAKDGATMGPKSRGQKDKNAGMFNFTFNQGTEAGASGKPAGAQQASLKGAASAANTKRKVVKRNRWRRRNRKDRYVPASPWPLTVQAWASFTAADPGLTLTQRKSPPGQESWEEERRRKYVCSSLGWEHSG